MAERGDIHPATRTKPALTNDCFGYFEVYSSLSASRNYNQSGPQPIPTSEIESELRLRGIDDQFDKEKYLRLVKKLDRVELDYKYDQLKAKAK